MVLAFRQVEHLYEILRYHWDDFDSKKVQEKWKLAWFWRFVRAVAKTGQTMPTSLLLQLCQFQNFTNSKKRYLKGIPIDFTQKGSIVCEL